MNKLFELKWSVCLMIAALFVMSSCATKKVSVNTTTPEMKSRLLFEKIQQNTFDYEWFSAKMNISSSVDGKENPNLGGLLRMKRDSVIWVSATAAFGLEVLRVKITTDSIWMLNRLEKNYYCDALENTTSRFGINTSFDMLQSVLLGNCIRGVGSDTVNPVAEKAKIEILGNRYRILFDDANEEQSLSSIYNDVWVEGSNFRPIKMSITDDHSEMPRAEFLYDAFETINNQDIATVMKLLFNYKRTLEASVKYSGIAIDVPLQFPMKIGDKLERVY